MKRKLFLMSSAAALCGTFLMSAASAPALLDDVSVVPVTSETEVESEALISGYSTIITSNKTALSVDAVKTFCEIESKLDIVVESNSLTGNADQAGEYQIVFSVTDDEGTKVRLPVTCIIDESISNVYYVESEFVYISSENVMNLQKKDLIDLLVAAEQVDSSKQYSAKVNDTDGLFSVLETESAEVEVKDYDVSIDIVYADGNTDSFNQSIKVFDDEEVDFQTKEDSWFMKGIKWIHNCILKPIGRIIWTLIDYFPGTIYRCVRWLFTGEWIDYLEHKIF